ncbi:MAG TPA: type III-B CRISPR module RAMP protein Cmr1 [Alphaproteobacteria bacterium]|nr:type III-B CRISPR module RAMP protein Cmr1 [Alphaproteobacteria bacterium]
MRKVTLTLKLLTPLWTGGIDNSADRMHETGLIGSLRWWYEAILRGCGVNACDPTAHNCSGCPACLAYGTTGQRRMWRLTLQGSVQHPFNGDPVLLPSGRIRRPANRRPQPGGWYVGNGFVGSLSLQVVPLCRAPSRTIWELPLHLAAMWGGIGPKTQMGCGVVQVLDENGSQITADIDALVQDLPTGAHQVDDLPDLRRFFFAKLRFTASSNWWKQVALIDTALARQVRDAQGAVPLRDISAELTALADLGCVPVAPRFGTGCGMAGRLPQEKVSNAKFLC